MLSSASCPAVGRVGVTHPSTASPSVRGGADAGGERGWRGLSQQGWCQQACCPRRPASCHHPAVTSLGPPLAPETGGPREQGCTERHEPSAQDLWFGMWGDAYPGVGGRAAGREEHPQNPRLPHGSAVKRHLKVPELRPPALLVTGASRGWSPGTGSVSWIGQGCPRPRWSCSTLPAAHLSATPGLSLGKQRDAECGETLHLAAGWDEIR